MIRFTTLALELAVPVAEALLEFAGRDTFRPHIGVGVDAGDICATDGSTAIRMNHADPTDTQPTSFNGMVFARADVERATKIAKAGKTSVVLQWSTALGGDVKFPPLSAVESQNDGRGVEPTSAAPVLLDPRFLARFVKVAKACDMTARGACNGPAVQLKALTGTLDPVGFYIDGPDHDARITIMPRRAD